VPSTVSGAASAVDSAPEIGARMPVATPFVVMIGWTLDEDLR
jgi:hypothetical protein